MENFIYNFGMLIFSFAFLLFVAAILFVVDHLIYRIFGTSPLLLLDKLLTW